MFALFSLCLIVGILYLSWRAIFTIDYFVAPHLLIWPLILFTAELYSFVVFTLFSFATVNIRKLKSESKIKDINYFPDVDIFICTYNESENMLWDTITGCKNIKYQNKKIYLLDDGNRDSMKKLAEQLGVNYISRKSNVGYKAGNINNALKQTNSEFVAVFDADHIPVSTFLIELMDFFKNEKIAMVQSPQHFLNKDPFQKLFSKWTNKMTTEQDLFFRVIQPGLDQWNAAICAGTNFIMRRKYVNLIGGIPQKAITEDMDLGVQFHSMGLIVKYYNKPLAAGLAPETFAEYVSQRLRWCTGTLQIFIFNKKSQLNKLSFAQKIFYLNGVLYYFFGIPRLVFLLSPILYLIFKIEPLHALLVHTIIFLAIYFYVKIYFFNKIAQRYRNFAITDIYETSVAFYLALNVIMTLIKPGKKAFKVTKKEQEKFKTNVKLFIPQLIILILALLSYAIVVYEYFTIYYLRDAVLANLFWNTYNTILLFFSVAVVIERKETREERRAPTKLEADLEDKQHHRIKMDVINISKKGALLFSQRDKKEEFEAILENENSIYLPHTEKIKLKVIDSYKKGDGRYYRVNFDIDTKEKEDELLKIVFNDSENW